MVSRRPKQTFDTRLHQVALITACVGITVSLVAAAIFWITRGVIAEEMLAGTAFAAVAAWPVWRAYRRQRESSRR